jgi:hypothetical protein
VPPAERTLPADVPVPKESATPEGPASKKVPN